MSPTLKAVPVAAFISVLVSVGTVTVYNSLGPSHVDPPPAAQVPEGTSPELVRLPEELEAIRGELLAVRSQVRELQENASRGSGDLPARIDTLEKRTAAAEAQLAGLEITPNAEDLAAKDPEKLRGDIESLFSVLEKHGVAAYMSPKLSELAEKVEALGDDGLAFVHDQLGAEEKETRFLAAALAEKLQDPALIDGLATSAMEDDDFMVRRMAAHALASMGHEEAGDALADIVEKETRDAGVRLNAWHGLASLERPEAVTTFSKILESAGGDVSADLVVDTALKTSHPALLPELRKAYDHSAVTVGVKIRILRTLGQSDPQAYGDFLRSIAENSSVDEGLRRAAAEALAGE